MKQSRQSITNSQRSRCVYNYSTWMVWDCVLASAAGWCIHFYCLAFYCYYRPFLYKRIICTYYNRASVWHIYTTFYLFICTNIIYFFVLSGVGRRHINNWPEILVKSVKARRKMHSIMYTLGVNATAKAICM